MLPGATHGFCLVRGDRDRARWLAVRTEATRWFPAGWKDLTIVRSLSCPARNSSVWPGAVGRVQDAKNSFSEVVEAARRTPQTVIKRGKPAVVVVDVVEYERLRRLECMRAPSFADVLLAMPQDDGDFPRGNVRMRDLDL
jgi:antitoxin Phd